jgi:uncharacterized protein YdhG (YjbR/CyaY superfamily)
MPTKKLPSQAPAKLASIDDYIAAQPADVQDILQEIRATVRKAAPKATERISYGMPCWAQDGVLVYVGAFKKHIGLYPPVGDAALKEKAARYAGPKGNLQFPLDEPMPHALIGKIVKARVAENRARAAQKASAKTGSKSR